MIIKLLEIEKPTTYHNHIYSKEVAKKIVEQINSRKVKYVMNSFNGYMCDYANAVAKINRAFIDDKDNCVKIDIDWLDNSKGYIMKELYDNNVIMKEFYPCGSGIVNEEGRVDDYKFYCVSMR